MELELSLMGSRLGMVSGFDDLLALPMLRDVEPLEYQRKTVLKVLRQFRGRALLADEVGLGKTIEACLVLLELVVRRLVRKVLIVTPPSLIKQWEGELRRKFGLHFTSFDAEEFKEQGDAAWSRFSHVLASFHTAKRDPHRSAVLAQEWDMVIVDEAHHLRNRSTLLWKLASSLKTKYMLLLTATPVQNSVEDLHSLVTVLKPGLLRTPKDFHRRFTDRADRLMPKNLPELNRLVADVMVRNRRGTTGVAFTRRTAHTQAVSFFLPEREMYAGVSRVVRQALREHTGLSRMALLTLQKELGSSTRAAAATLRKLASEPRLGHALRVELQDLASAASLISGSAKLDRLAELVSSFPGKMLIFTQFRETQSAIMERLSAEGVPAVQFHGGLSRLEKEEVVRRFQEETRVMVATDAGSEGRNLQFCNAICNFDLPWNPMRIEQRIGRLSRIGQQRDVEVFNLVATDTLEAAILHLLEAKIAMFELVVVRST
jgi:SNF2 family DNA or RNA helicase